MLWKTDQALVPLWWSTLSPVDPTPDIWNILISTPTRWTLDELEAGSGPPVSGDKPMLVSLLARYSSAGILYESYPGFVRAPGGRNEIARDLTSQWAINKVQYV